MQYSHQSLKTGGKEWKSGKRDVMTEADVEMMNFKDGYELRNTGDF
jgi:hypothetical protein